VAKGHRLGVGDGAPDGEGRTLGRRRSASEAVTYAVQAAREAGEGMTRLRVGYPAGAASASVPLAVRIFRERFPSVALDTVVGQAGAHLSGGCPGLRRS
jgi:DNA-binding transcriptional LysR family regulator